MSDQTPLLSALKKQPTQPRALRTVERIIAATGELVLAQGLDALGDTSVEESTRLWASLGIQHFRQSGGIMAELLKSQHMITTLPEGRDFERRLMEAMHRFLARQRDRLDVENLDRAIYIAFNACSAILTRHLLEPAPFYTDTEVVEEVTTLMTRYFYRR